MNRGTLHLADCGLRSAECQIAPRHRTHSAIRNPKSAIGFTLIEILVVVAILMILLGIGIAYGPGMLAPNEISQTRITLKNLVNINDEFASRTGSHADASNINQFLMTVTGGTASYQLGQQEPFSGMVASFDDKILRRVDPKSTTSPWKVYDAWGQEIYYNKPNTTVSAGFPVKPFAYFASVGPDGQAGNLSSATNAPAYLQTRDNIYSFGN